MHCNFPSLSMEKILRSSFSSLSRADVAKVSKGRLFSSSALWSRPQARNPCIIKPERNLVSESLGQGAAVPCLFYCRASFSSRRKGPKAARPEPGWQPEPGWRPANFCIREWRPRAPVSYHLDFALEGCRATFASRGAAPNLHWCMVIGYRLSPFKGTAWELVRRYGSVGTGRALEKPPSIIRCADAAPARREAYRP